MIWGTKNNILHRILVMKHFLSMIVLMAVVPSCIQQSSYQKKFRKTDRYIAKKLDVKDVSALDGIRLQEAKMRDIPIPLSAKPLPEYFDPDNPIVMLGYEDSTLSPAGIEDFYTKEMERLGWKSEEQFIGHESLLRFTNPQQRSCLISIRFDYERQCTSFVIATGAKDILG